MSEVAANPFICVAAIPNSNGNTGYRYALVFMKTRDIQLISEVFCILSSNLGLLESQ